MTKEKEDQLALELIMSLELPPCPKNKCERCRDVGEDVPSTCVVISSPKLPPYKKWLCYPCAKHLEENWGYIVMRRVK